MSVPYYMPPAVAPNPMNDYYRSPEISMQLLQQIQNTHNMYKMAYQDQYYSQPHGFDGGVPLAANVIVPQARLMYPQLSPSYPQMPGLHYPNLPTSEAAMQIPQEYLQRSEPKPSYTSQLKIIADRIAESDASSKPQSKRASRAKPAILAGNRYVPEARLKYTVAQNNGNSRSGLSAVSNVGSNYIGTACSRELKATSLSHAESVSKDELVLEHNNVEEATNMPQAVIPQSGSVSERAIVTSVISIKEANKNDTTAGYNMQAPQSTPTQRPLGGEQSVEGFPQALVNPFLNPAAILQPSVEQQNFTQALIEDPNFQQYMLQNYNSAEGKRRRQSESDDCQPAAKFLCYEFYPQPASANLDYLFLGANGTCVPASFYVTIPWESPCATIKLLMEFLFDEYSLCNHTLENPLNPKIIDDIVSLISRKCDTSQQTIRIMVSELCAYKANRYNNGHK